MLAQKQIYINLFSKGEARERDAAKRNRATAPRVRDPLRVRDPPRSPGKTHKKNQPVSCGCSIQEDVSMTRSELREHCFKILFCADFYPAEEKVEQMKRYFEEPKEDAVTPEGVEEILHNVSMSEKHEQYLKNKAEDIMCRVPELDDKINGVAQGWKTKRMGKVDLTVLRLALYEMIYDEEVPEKVAINEAVELAKKFGGDESPAFINGVLAKLVHK